MATFHNSENEAESNFADGMDKVCAGGEVEIESGDNPKAVLRPAWFRYRSVSQSVVFAEVRERKLGDSPAMDDDYAADMEGIVRNRKLGKPSDM